MEFNFMEQRFPGVRPLSNAEEIPRKEQGDVILER
jgi:hypothetical protein